jgi:hypothetical protein
MWEKGISAYIGLNHSLDTVCSYLTLARSYGYTRLFTSLHIPEADPKLLLRDFQTFIAVAVDLGYTITADISPAAFTMLKASMTDLSPLKKLGISALRLDYGFSPQEIATITHTSGLQVELNASTITPGILQQIQGAQADLTKIRACHNYYPRPETGLSFPLFAERSKLFRDYNIPVLAFIASRSCPRGPIFAGLPTLEKHRKVTPKLAAKELLACQSVDGIIFGDPLVTEEELASISLLTRDCMEIEVTISPGVSNEERELLFLTHTNRMDPGEGVIRSQEARTFCQHIISPRPALPRQRGAVTIDNQDYLRYMGELQLINAPLPADGRVNVVAHVIPEEVFLLSYIKPGGSFRLKEVTQHES